MKIIEKTKNFILFASLISFINCADDKIIDFNSENVLPTGENSKDWELVFQDEFNSNSLDLAKWSAGLGWIDKKAERRSKFTNENIFFDDGKLILKAEIYSDDIYSAAINSKNKFFQRYGFFEAKLKAGEGNGVISRWFGKQFLRHWAPAIDAVQIMGDNPGADSLYGINKNNAAIRWLIAPERETSRGKVFKISDDSLKNDFHIIGIKWQPDEIIWYLDGEKVLSISEGTEDINVPLYWIFDLSYCDDFEIPNYECPDSSANNTARMEVDYFRVWR